MLRSSLLWLVPFIVAVGCTPRRAVERAVLYDRVVQVADIPFGMDARQRLDVYRPRRMPRHAPVVVFMYPGRWKYGSKRDYLLIGNALARRGWIVVIPDYRLYPNVRYPAFAEDGAAAVRWTRDSIARFGGDPSRIVVMGHSAGAHTVAMLALDEHFLRNAGVPADGIRGFVSISGPVDTTWTEPDVQDIMGPRERWLSTYPRTFIDGNEPPLLLLHGAGDDIVSSGNSTRLAELIQARGGCARAVVYPRIGHVRAAVDLLSSGSLVMRDVAAFVEDPAATACGIP